ncbi:hypothetical protein Vafri_53 [Volvox africanus]|nr:hypothetical protein Vafri_53 [Volvox africanus]
MLPSQYWVWRSWTHRSSSPPDLPWVLKANDHRGRGVRVMRQKQAQRQALRGSGAQAAGDPATQTGFVLVQSYVRRQFLYDNRPSYLRLWVVVTSVRPLRAYLFRGGVLVFGDRLGPSGRGSGGSATATGQGTSRQHSRRRLRLQPGEAAQTQYRRVFLAAGDSWNPNDRGIRGHLPQQQQQQQRGGLGKNSQQYEMHQVNYWTISGEKMHPWTVGQLRRHAEAVNPNDPKMFERMWAHARTSVGMVLASATRRMRTAARGLAALEGSGFEVLGVDFLLNATLHPTLVEVNALPSLARLRLAPGDPVHAGGGGSADGLSAGSAHSPVDSAGPPGPAPPFDLEKERFLHHAIRLIGIPIGPPPFRGGDFNTSITGAAASAAAAPTAGAAASRGAASPSVGGILRAMVALLRPPNNETAELQAFLRLHLPLDVVAAEAALSNLRSLLCPVPAAWGPAPGWPVLEAANVAAESTGSGSRRLVAAATAQAEDTARQFPELIADRRPMGWGDMKRHVALAQVPKRGAGSGGRGTAWQGNTATRTGEPERLKRFQYSDSDAASAKAVIMDTTLGLDGKERISLPEHDVQEKTGDSRALARRSLQSATSVEAASRGGRRILMEESAGEASGGGIGHGVTGAQMQQPCRRRCYDWDVLAAIADTEYELQQNLDFDPIFPLATAHDLNRAALEAAGRVETAATQMSQAEEGARSGSGTRSSGSDSTGSGSGSGSETFRGSALLNPQTGLQKLQTSLNFVRESITSVNMDMMRSMRYMTTTPYVLARTALPYSRIDVALSAYEAVRRREDSCAVRISVNGAAAAVESATCAVQVLQDTLEEACSGRMKPEQE